jgi:hypothetical protein
MIGQTPFSIWKTRSGTEKNSGTFAAAKTNVTGDL